MPLRLNLEDDVVEGCTISMGYTNEDLTFQCVGLSLGSNQIAKFIFMGLERK